ncbi:CHAT domain-containing protein [Adonisia turfae]|uniref:CHAT domain-containing protein n=1 Tax=Adonisia turfae TaxID=2950184 RepID=UPI0013D3DC9D|nr:CHAT domain-containing protein [Adonisia turfae]
MTVFVVPAFSSNTLSNPEDVFHNGQVAYENQRYDDAIKYLNEALRGFQNPDQDLKRAIVFSNLSLTYQALENWEQAQESIDDSLKILKTDRSQFSENSVPNLPEPQLRVLAPTLDVDGQLWMKLGQPEDSLQSWRQSAQIYRYLQNIEGLIGSEINQLKVLQSLGLYAQADGLFTNLEQQLSDIQDNAVQVQDDAIIDRSLHSLGDAYKAVGKLTCSRNILENLVIARGLSDAIEEKIIPSTPVCLNTVLDKLSTDQNKIDNSIIQQEWTSNVLTSLGNTYLALGNRAKEREFTINRQDIPPWRCSLAMDDLSEEATNFYNQAVTAYTDAGEQTQMPQQKVAAQLNQMDALLELQYSDLQALELWNKNWSSVKKTLTEKTLAGQKLEDDDFNKAFRNRFGVYAQIKLAKQGACQIQPQPKNDSGTNWDAVTELRPIIKLLDPLPSIATELKDPIAMSQAYGNLGGLYEFISWWSTPDLHKAFDNDIWHKKALTQTKQALYLAQSSKLPDIAYQWQWQLARLHKVEGQTEIAIQEYQQAVDTLQVVRNNLRRIDSEVQFSFRDNVEPVYRELVDLLLQPPDNQLPSGRLEEAVELIDTLQLAELESFLQCNLEKSKITQDVIDENAVSIYSIILRDRLEIILSYPNRDPETKQQRFERRRHKIEQDDLEDAIETLQSYLVVPSRESDVKEIAGKLYDWIIQPLEHQLERNKPIADSQVRTLVFVLDGSLRNIPMSVLFDQTNKEYLLQRYAIATVSSLSLVQPQTLARPINILLGGSNEILLHPLKPDSLKPNFELPALQNVEKELEAIEKIFPKSSEKLLNKSFNRRRLENTLSEKQFSVVHLATHGEFSSDPERTFILLSREDESSQLLGAPLYAKGIDSLLRAQNNQSEGIKMLVLSACETAQGDKRATLGIAGLTIRAGSRSTLATLWSVKDEPASEMMTQFYQQLNNDKFISRAEALRRAQLSLWDQNDWSLPLHWAPYTLVGNWF